MLNYERIRTALFDSLGDRSKVHLAALGHLRDGKLSK